jgi:hypothetical protein
MLWTAPPTGRASVLESVADEATGIRRSSIRDGVCERTKKTPRAPSGPRLPRPSWRALEFAHHAQACRLMWNSVGSLAHLGWLVQHLRFNGQLPVDQPPSMPTKCPRPRTVECPLLALSGRRKVRRTSWRASLSGPSFGSTGGGVGPTGRSASTFNRVRERARVPPSGATAHA